MAVYLPIVTVCPVYRMSDLNPSGMDTFTCTVNACVALSSEEHAAMITVTAANIIFVIKRNCSIHIVIYKLKNNSTPKLKLPVLRCTSVLEVEFFEKRFVKEYVVGIE